jgi:ribosomal protein S27E
MTAKTKNRQDPAIIQNTGHLCSVYCPDCGKVTDKISFNLLREAGTVEVTCPSCCGITIFEYKGKKAAIRHYSEELEEITRKMLKESQHTRFTSKVDKDEVFDIVNKKRQERLLRGKTLN